MLQWQQLMCLSFNLGSWVYHEIFVTISRMSKYSKDFKTTQSKSLKTTIIEYKFMLCPQAPFKVGGLPPPPQHTHLLSKLTKPLIIFFLEKEAFATIIYRNTFYWSK